MTGTGLRELESVLGGSLHYDLAELRTNPSSYASVGFRQLGLANSARRLTSSSVGVTPNFRYRVDPVAPERAVAPPSVRPPAYRQELGSAHSVENQTVIATGRWSS